MDLIYISSIYSIVVVIFFCVSSRGKFRHRKLFILALFSLTILGSGVHGRYRDDLSEIEDFKFDDDWSLSTSTYGVEVDFRKDVFIGVLCELACWFIVYSAICRLRQPLLRQQQHLMNSLLKLIVNIPGTNGNFNLFGSHDLTWYWVLNVRPISSTYLHFNPTTPFSCLSTECCCEHSCK